MEVPILHEKVHRPDPRGLARERLEQRLLGPGGPTITLVLGPPGAGKTTLLSRVASVSGRPCGWYRAGPEDDNEAALVRHVGRSLSDALGAGGLLEAAEPGLVDPLLAALDVVDGQVDLVVDDLHVVAGTPAERALERFLLLRPRTVRVLLGSRRPPLINTSRLLVAGELGQLDAEDLRFRSWEVEELFRTVYRSPLSPEAAAALTRRTGGWAAGLQLFHLGTLELTRYEREQAVAELTGRSRLIRSYLARNVLDGLDAGRRRFLLTTCTLGVLTGRLCDTLLQRNGSAAVLDELERQQFFTTSADGGTTFRYHQVLQTHLEVLLVDELGVAEARRLYARSADLLERDGRTTAAVQAYARAEDWGAVARLAPRGSSWPVDDERLEAVLGSLAVPADDPGLVLAGARRLFRQGRVRDAVTAYRQAEELLDDRDFRAGCVRERLAIAVWLPDAPHPDRPVGEAAHGADRLAQLRALTRLPAPCGGVLLPLPEGARHLLAGDPAAAVRCWRAALLRGGPDNGEGLALRLALLVAEAWEGPDERAPRHLEELVLSADLAGLPWLSRVARGVQAAALLVTQPAAWRVEACHEQIEECERRDDLWAVCLLGAVTGWWATRAGQASVGIPLLRRAADCAQALDAPALRTWVEAALAYAPVSEHDPGAHRTDSARAVSQRPVGIHTVELRCLGAFELSVDGRPCGWRLLRPKVRTLLHRLALVHGRPVHRERLIDELWPEATLASGTRSLQVAVSSLRQCLVAAGLPVSSVDRQGDAYALVLPRADDQLRDFERLVRTGRREDEMGAVDRALDSWLGALDRYAGELLPEAGTADWVVEDRDRFRLLAAEAGAGAGRAALTLGELTRGVQAARRSVELDPYHDTSWGALTELLERLGDHSAAAVCRREHAAALAELGLPTPVRLRGR